MGFIWPRLIKVTRADHQAADGPDVSYGGTSRETETLVETEDGVVLEDIPCNIQARAGGRKNPTNLPADTVAAQWFINIPPGAVPEGSIKDRDFITDDLGRRFQCTADYDHSLGQRLTVDRLEL